MYIAILWHMHQPDYRHPDSGAEEMPWVRLHAIKDYYDMARLVDEAPENIRVTFNLTPVLLSQLHQIVTQGPKDAFHRVARRPVRHLRPEDRLFLLNNFFSVNEERMLRPLPRYNQLFRRMGGGLARLSVVPDGFSDQDFLDLTVLFHLTWCGRTLREDGLVRHLLGKGSHYSEDERNQLLDLQNSFIAHIVPFYRHLWEKGRVELSTTPLHHPILPLLVDSRAAREGDPHCPVEGLGFRFPEDAETQVIRGRQLAEQMLGRLPAGMWPSEGAVSDRVVRILESLDVAWIATDQQVLERSLLASGTPVSSTPHLRPWRLRGTRGPVMFFRDTPISDRIGFTYSRWKPAEAVDDFLMRARTLLATDPDAGNACLPIILDGENAWEYYENDGAEFLAALYRGIASAPDLKTITFSDAAASLPVQVLPRIRAGSWIHANLNTWAGHPEKNRAWELLTEARKELKDLSESPDCDKEAMIRAREILLRAEASDWFWWLGDDHPTYYKNTFEELFRRNLQAAWRAMNRPIPATLHRPITGPERSFAVEMSVPFALIRPKIDGSNAYYYDWVGAGTLKTAQQSGAIFTGDPLIARLDYGFDTKNLYFRLRTVNGRADDQLRDADVQVILREPDKGLRWNVIAENTHTVVHMGPDGSLTEIGEWAVGRVFEMRIDYSALGLLPGNNLAFHLEILLADGLAERLPMEGAMESSIPSAHFNRINWSL